MPDLLETLGAQASPGWAKLGNALTGGADTTSSYMKGQKERASLDELLARAKIKQGEAMQREQFRAALEKSGIVDPKQMDLVTAVTLGGIGSDYSGAMSGMQTGTETGLMTEAATAGRGGDIDLANVLSSARTGNPLERTAISGGVAYDPYAAPDLQKIATTPVGAAAIEADQARADKARRVDTTANKGKAARDYITEDIVKRELDAVDSAINDQLAKARTPAQRQEIEAKRRQGYAEVQARHGVTPKAPPKPANQFTQDADLMTAITDMAVQRRKAGKRPMTGRDVEAVEKMKRAGAPMIDPVDMDTADAADASRKKAGVQEPADSINTKPIPRDGTQPPAVVDLDASLRGSKPPASTPGTKKAKPPMKGARQAKDGNWYIPDPNRPGKYLRVDG